MTIPLIHIIESSNRLISFLSAHVDMVFLLPVVAEAQRPVVIRAFFRDDIDDTCHGFAAIENGSTTLDDLDPFDGIGGNLLQIIKTSSRDRIAVDHYQRTVINTANRRLVDHRPHGSAQRRKGREGHAVDLLDDLRRVLRAAALDLFPGNDVRGHGHIHVPLLRPRGGNHDLIKAGFLQSSRLSPPRGHGGRFRYRQTHRQRRQRHSG